MTLKLRRRLEVAALPAFAATLTLAPAAAQNPKGSAAHITAATQKVNGTFIRTNEAKTADWPSYGLDYAEMRFSRLTGINENNVKDLGLVWSHNLESARGVEATPLVVDGIMYVTAAWSVVHAVDVRTGKRIWTYDPKVLREAGYKGCCDVVNRGVALYEGEVFVASFDGRLNALNAATGKVAWEKDTIENKKMSYTTMGAARVFKGKVIIGNGGAEYGVRGYITAYDAATGDQKWRWYTVPGDPGKPFENEAMEKAAKTWDPAGKWWELGGGGTAWDTMTFDPELNLMYIGTGNCSPWAHAKRSPAGGDNLYLASIVALNFETGKYVWHYQQTPGDNWGYASSQPMILANQKIDDKPRKVILHAPKNGFFYVPDRTNGKFISAKNFVPVNWATGYDKDGRPMVNPEARNTDKPFEVEPSAYSARNWHSMSFNPQTGLVYMPAQGVPLTLMDNKACKPDESVASQPHGNLGWNMARMAIVEPPKDTPFWRLIAWDPIAQKAAWTNEQVSPCNGGALSTAGNLVFQGTADGRFIAYNAKTGDKLWESPTGTGVIPAPSTCLVDGKQYVLIAVGWGGVYGLSQRATDRRGPGTVYTFAVGGKAPMPKFVKYRVDELVPGVKYDPAQVQVGTLLYVNNCVFCHGVPGVDRGGNVPNLGCLNSSYIENLGNFVYKGPANERGMPDFTGKLNKDEIEQIKAFIQGTADAIRPKKVAQV